MENKKEEEEEEIILVAHTATAVGGVCGSGHCVAYAIFVRKFLHRLIEMSKCVVNCAK